MAVNHIRSLLMVLFLVCEGRARSQTQTFDVMEFGTVEGGRTDSSEALLGVWRRACESGGTNVVLVPRGTFLLNPVILVGSCKGRVQLQIEGTLRASTENSNLDFVYWISFQYVDNLSITGSGTLDGQGASAWKYNDCSTNPKCKTPPTTIQLDFVNNTWIHDIASVDSKNAHLNKFARQNVTVERVNLTVPQDSPNTDGIKISMSTDVYIRDSNIGTGDDCIALLPWSQRINISHVYCGPGHRISVGSLGGSPNEKPISSVWVENCSFMGTANWMRIKTEAPSYKGLVLNVTFANIRVDDASNPILIEQQYCPSKEWAPKEVSLVAIHNITYRNITGISSSQLAVNLQCSPEVPCLGIELQDIDLSYDGKEGATTSSCTNIVGSSLGKQDPPSCIGRKTDHSYSIWW